MSNFTEGPWSVCKGGDCQCGYVFGDGGEVYVAQAIGPKNTDEHGCPDPHPNLETQKNNAKLIADAPTMREALNEAEYALRNSMKRDDWRDCEDLLVWADHWLQHYAALFPPRNEDIIEKMAQFCEALIKEGWGRTSDRALPGEFDSICLLLAERGRHVWKQADGEGVSGSTIEAQP